MSIKEALERRRIGIKSGARQRQEASLRPFDDSIYAESDYRQKVLEKGRSIHKEAGIPKLLEDLAETIRPDFPDVKIEEGLTANGTVSSEIVWSFRDSSAIKPFKHAYNAVSIIAYPLTENVAVRGQEEFVVLKKSQWSSDPQLLEDTVVRAYHKPLQMLGPPARI